MMLLLGQRAPGSELVRATMREEAWRAQLAGHRATSARSLPQRAALEALDADPSLLRAFLTDPLSWGRKEAGHASSLALRAYGETVAAPP